jgi:TonB-linked SusC/RagA family outer membrane protein
MKAAHFPPAFSSVLSLLLSNCQVSVKKLLFLPTHNAFWLRLQYNQTFRRFMTKLAVLLRTTFFLGLLICASHSKANSQNQKVTINAKEETLAKIFKQIKSQTKLVVFYSNDLVNDQEKITLNVKEETLTAVMDKIIAGKPLKYEIREKNIVISARPVETKPIQPGSAVTELPVAPPTVRGRITNEKGEPVAGVSISIKGGKVIGVTDEKGDFVLNNVPDNATLVFEAVTIEKFETKLNGRSELALSAKVKINQLEEVVINKGYYTEKQKFSVGNVGRVTAKDIEKQPVNNVLLALQGRVAGLSIVQNSGVPGGGITVRIQGQNSIGNGNDPLYVIDGVPIQSQLSRASDQASVLGEAGGPSGITSYGSPLSFINPSDIESIEVLKDADATAIYGSRAANGALLITTKKAKAGKIKLDANVQQGWGKVTRMIKIMDRRQYLDMRYEAYRNEGTSLSSLTTGTRTYDLKLWDTTRSTNWQDVLIGGTAQYTNANATVSGGTSNVQYVLGTTYSRETTVFPGSFADQKASVHFALNNVSTDERFRLQFTGNYMLDDNRLPGVDLTQSANQLEPVAPALYNADGTLNWAPAANGTSSWNNPLVSVLYRKYSNKTNNLISNLTLQYRLLKGLELKSSFGYSYLTTDEFYGTPMISIRPESRANATRSANYGNRTSRSWIIEPQLSYNVQIGSGVLDALTGVSIQQSSNKSGSLNGSGYASDQVLEEMKAAATVSVGNSFISQYKYNAAFARLNYNYNSRYIINANARRDGSSRFGANNRFHNFGSIGAAWIFSEESFISQSLPLISFGKFRASYGTSGSDQIQDYQYLSQYGFVNGSFSGTDFPYQNMVGLVPGNLPNPNLQWEETKKLQAGIDLGFFNNRLSLGVTYARNRSSNQLLAYSLPTYTGNSFITTNFPATVQNTSWEFSLSSINIKGKAVSWTTDFNLTIPRNKLVSFPMIEQSTYFGTLEIGQPLYPSRLFPFAGVNPATGLYQVYDNNGVITTTPNFATDRRILVSTLPIFYGGLTNRITYKGFELDIFLQFVKQIGPNNFFNNGSGNQPGYFTAGGSNQPVSVLGRWQKAGDVANIQRFSPVSGTVRDQLVFAQQSNEMITDASFVRVKNLSLAWTLPGKWQKKTGLQNAQIYAHAQNLLTFTKFKGADPEVRGFASLPPLRVITVGIKLGL